MKNFYALQLIDQRNETSKTDDPFANEVNNDIQEISEPLGPEIVLVKGNSQYCDAIESVENFQN